MSFLVKRRIFMNNLISTQKALDIILDQTKDFGIEEVSYDQSLGRVLKEDIFADRDFPPFDRVSMDGIAIDFQSFEKGQRDFEIDGVQAAGSKQLELSDSLKCMEVMTGAVLPIGTDTVIPYEQVQINDGVATILLDEFIQFKNVHSKGKDQQQGTVVIEKNKLISSAEIGVLATVGKSVVKVAKLPKVMIISTGDELVGVNETPANYQIRRSNVHTLVSLLARFQIEAQSDYISDNKEILKSKISKYLIEFDVLLFSGAVSKGKFDFIPEVLDQLGVEKLFHKVAQRPGKPFWFGRKVSVFSQSEVSRSSSGVEMSPRELRNTVVFAFPGNPISTFVSCVKYFFPWMQKSIQVGFENPNFAKLTEDVSFKPSMTYFMQVKLENRKGELWAIPYRGNGSGDLASLVQTDAFIELPADETEFKKGEVFPILKYRE